MSAINLFLAVAVRAAEEVGRPISEDMLRALVDEDAIEAAFRAPFESVDGDLLYPNPIQQAAILASRIIHSGPLPHGLERLAAVLFVDLFLEQAHVELSVSPAELDFVFQSVADHIIRDDELIGWFIRRTRPLRTLS